MIEPPLEADAQKMLDYISGLDPAWSERLVALREERHGLSALKTLALLCCYTLESGNHMSIPALPQLMDDFVPAGAERECPYCQTPYRLAYPGQPFCSNLCAEAARGVPQRPPTMAGTDSKARKPHRMTR